jgi:para-nitrobenzyl esterase
MSTTFDTSIRAHALIAILFALTACAGDSAQKPPAATSAKPVDGLLVTLDDGQLQGEMAGEARRFINIPFAKAPVGDLRWRAPQPNEPWSGVRHETEFVTGCPQLADQGAPASDNEDCLYLNVWSPEPAPDHAPVMVWFHGGGNFSGGTGIPIPTTQQLWYDGQAFAENHGIVLVTLQYRLGPLGFFSHPALAAEDSPLGNQGLLDQRMALHWVQKNIAQFGGDPKNVTIFGESAGSADVCYHVASPGSRGLFQRAIGESGGCTTGGVGAELNVKDTAAPMQAYAAALGCAEGDDQLACMRRVSIADLLGKAMQPMPGGDSMGAATWSFAAVVGGRDAVLPDTPRAIYQRGDIARVPYLLGSNHDEGTTFVIRATPLMSETDYQSDLKLRFGTAANAVEKMYPVAAFDGDYNAARARVVGDSTVVCSTHDTARLAAQAGLSVFMYDFDMPWSIAPDLLRAGHASEISHVFGLPYLPMPDAESQAVADAMNGYWSAFAKAGDPNHDGAPAQWPAFKVDADKRLQLDPAWSVLDDFRTQECDFWSKLAGLD